MAKKTKIARVVCMRVSDQPQPVVPSTLSNCVKCGEPIWVGHDLEPETRQFKKIEYFCNHCISPMAAFMEVLSGRVKISKESQERLGKLLDEIKKKQGPDYRGFAQ